MLEVMPPNLSSVQFGVEDYLFTQLEDNVSKTIVSDNWSTAPGTNAAYLGLLHNSDCFCYNQTLPLASTHLRIFKNTFAYSCKRM